MSYQNVNKQTNLSRLMMLFAVMMVIVSLTGAGCATPKAAEEKKVETDAATGLPIAAPVSDPAILAGEKGEEAVPTTTPATKPADKPGAAAAPSQTTVITMYKDGKYDTVGDYNSPAGLESINVSLTLKDDVVTDATVVGTATNPKSKFMQSEFIGGFKTQVIGRKLEDIKLDKISGSSLTPKGFNDAVAKTKVLAKA